ncbi:MAG: hypothetical protein AAGF53_01710 [Pseudomonadota bacterium]
MMIMLKKFALEEDGAITVDWVVLTAAIVGLGVGVISTVGTGADSVANAASAGIASTQVGLN